MIILLLKPQSQQDPMPPQLTHLKPETQTTNSLPSTQTTKSKSRVRYAEYEEARAYARSLKLSSFVEWRKYITQHTLPDFVPPLPEKTYSSRGWLGWADWLGFQTTTTPQVEFLPFEQARAFVQSLNIKGLHEWSNIVRRGIPFTLPPNIPPSPHHTYENHGWKDYPDWLGQHHPKTYLSYSESQTIVSEKGFQKPSEWKTFVDQEEGTAFLRKHRIPKHPNLFYQERGWNGWGEWFGVPNPKPHKKNYLPFEQARHYARSLGLTTSRKWNFLARTNQIPENIPKYPHQTYKSKGRKSMPDWLGYER